MLDGLAKRKGIGVEDVDPHELELGIREELEHTSDIEMATQIALDHLAEDPEYYTKLLAVFPPEDELRQEQFPEKLLDCDVVTDLVWPTTFLRVGEALRFDYSSQLHDDGVWAPFKHQTTTGVGLLVPAGGGMAASLGELGRVSEEVAPRPFEPVVMGLVDRLYFVTNDGDRIALARRGIGVDVEGMGDVLFDGLEIPETAFAWDPGYRRLLGVTGDSDVLFCLEGGLLGLDDEAMLVG